jgi:hypothetical protein
MVSIAERTIRTSAPAPDAKAIEHDKEVQLLALREVRRILNRGEDLTHEPHREPVECLSWARGIWSEPSRK